MPLSGCGSKEEKRAKFYGKGAALFEKGDYVKAKLELKNALQIDPEYANPYHMLARIEVREGNFPKAFALYSKAVALDPELLDAQVELGGMLLNGRHTEKAMEKAEFVLSREPEHEGALSLKAGCLRKDGKPDEAEKILDRILKINPKNPSPYLMRAGMRLKEKDDEAAVHSLQELLEHDNRNRTARMMLARIFERKGDVKDAEKEYQTLMEMNPGDNRQKLMFVDFYERIGRSEKAEEALKNLILEHPKEVEFRLVLARYYMKKKKTGAGIVILEKAVTDFPEEFGAYEMLTAYHVGTRDKGKALTLLDKFMEMTQAGPDYLKAKLFKARILLQEKKDEEALELVEEILEKNPRDIGTHALKGDIFTGRGDFPGAIAEYRAVLNEEPENIPMFLKLARAHIQNGEMALAEEIFKKLIEKKPGLREARFGLSEIYKRKGKPGLAETQLKKILETHANEGRAILFLGDLALARKDLSTALEYYARLSKLMPGSHLAHHKKGIVLMLQGRDGKAVKAFERALELNPDFVPPLSQRLRVMVKEKKLDMAIDRCKRQIEKRPENPGFHVLLGRLYILKKEPDLARDKFKKALELDPENKQALFNFARLEQSLGSLDKAIEKYEKILERNPKSLSMALLIATLYDAKGDHRKSRELYEGILVNNPNVPVAANNLAFYYAEYDPTEKNLSRAEELVLPLLQKYKGAVNLMDTAAWVYYRKGEFARALDLLMAVQDKGKEIPEYNYHLGMIYLAMGEKDKAKDYLRTAVESEGYFPGKETAVKVLETGLNT